MVEIVDLVGRLRRAGGRACDRRFAASEAAAAHGFNNDTTPRYDKAAADLAWKRTMDFFKQNLRG